MPKSAIVFFLVTIVSVSGLAQASDVINQPPAENNVFDMIKGGIGLGFISFSSTFFLSAEIKDVDVFKDDVRDPFYIGSAFGSLGLATGVHLGNQKRGNWILSTLTSLAIGAGGAKLIADSDDPWRWVLLVPAVQLVAVMGVESATTASHRQADETEYSEKRINKMRRVELVPIRGGMGITFSWFFQ